MPQPLPFNTSWMDVLVEHRVSPLLEFSQFASFMGEIEGYVLMVAALYVVLDKRLGVRLGVLVLLTMSLNHILKTILKNPRPFIADGTYLDHWAVSADRAQDLATEYSTPSGHAMAAAMFYGFIFAHTKNRAIRILAVAAAFLVGASRPYLGVHFVEDIIMGWAIGLVLVVIAVKYVDAVAAWWGRLPLSSQATICVTATMVLWAATIAMSDWRIDGQPRAFLGYAGLITGMLIAQPLELRLVDFDPKSSTWIAKLVRYIVSVALVLATLAALDIAFAAMVDEYSLPGYALQYVRYTIGGMVGIFVAPWLFTKAQLANVGRALARQ
jgi:membrane-associated phospholipid phosphatase